MPDENSSLQCGASHRNKHTRELRRTAVCSGTAADQRSGLFRTDAAVTYLLPLRCLAVVAVAISVPRCSLLQPEITFAPLPTILLLPVEKAVLHQSFISGAEKFDFVYAVEKPWVIRRHWWSSAAGGVLSVMEIEIHGHKEASDKSWRKKKVLSLVSRPNVSSS